jgi:DNA-directed RNA polymerase subunit RPC12/RpoP
MTLKVRLKNMSNTKYKCIKCGNGVSGNSHPLVGKCSKGGRARTGYVG